MYRRLYFSLLLVFGLIFSQTVLNATNFRFSTPIILAESQQEQAEFSVERYLFLKFEKLGFYQSLSFAELETIVPKEIVYLNDLKKMKQEALSMKDYYKNSYDSIHRVFDSLIVVQETEIKNKKIRNFYKIQHVFSVKQDKKYTLYEGNFYLSANLQVKDVELTLDMNLTEDDYDWFYFYTKQFNLFTGGDMKDVELSKDIYYFFSQNLSRATINKETAIRSMLIAIKVTRINNVFDPRKITQEVVRYQMLNSSSEFKNYVPQKFSITKQLTLNVNGKDSLIGYDLFHKFRYITENQNDTTACMYFELNPWFVITGTFIVNAPYEKYFENE